MGTDISGCGGCVEEVARARVRCAWAKFKELSPILTAWGASYHIKGKIYKACVQSVLTYGTETWATKKANLQSLERMERMMVRWMCGVSLKDRKGSVDLYMSDMGEYMSNKLEFTPHINYITTAVVQSTYALRVLRVHGLTGPKLGEVTRATAVAKLTYICSSWWVMRILRPRPTFRRL